MITNLFARIIDWENLLLAWRKARQAKRSQPPAATFEQRAGEHLLELQQELRSQHYAPGAYKSFVIYEPKRRIISAAPFRDRVVHHALCNVIEPIFERRFIYDSYANRTGKGTHAALARAQAFARSHRYLLSCDVQQYFPAIDHALLDAMLAKVIGDEEVRWLYRTILNSGRGVLSSVYEMDYFAGDDFFAVERARGLPIGNLTSQFWANVYLNPLDHFIKRELKCGAYLRYVDDFLLFADDKATLWRWKAQIVDYLASLRLTLHDARCQPRPVGEGTPFLGFVVYPDHLRLKRRVGVNYQRRLRQLWQQANAGRLPWRAVSASVRGWANHAATGQTYRLRRSVLRSPGGKRK